MIIILLPCSSPVVEIEVPVGDTCTADGIVISPQPNEAETKFNCNNNINFCLTQDTFL